MTQKQIEQTRVIAEKDGWKYLPHVRGFIRRDESPMRFTPDVSMPYLTDLNALHRVAMDVMDELEAMLIIPALQETIKIRSKCAYRPINGQYIDLFYAVYEGIVFLNENKENKL